MRPGPPPLRGFVRPNPSNPRRWVYDDSDAKGDDANGSGTPEHEEMDLDGDGWTDEEETKGGTDPLRRDSFPGD